MLSGKERSTLVIGLCACLLLISAVSIKQNRLPCGSIHNGGFEEMNSHEEFASKWEIVSHDFDHCEAQIEDLSTATILDSSGPSPAYGVAGKPQAGDRFASAILCQQDELVFHGGVTQTVDLPRLGVSYELSFFQAVVKHAIAIDTSGSWAVYCDQELIGISEPTISLTEFDDRELNWEPRSIIFSPKKSPLELSFLPHDDDSDSGRNPLNQSGALFMGLDEVCLQELDR